MSDSHIYQFAQTLQEYASQHRRHLHRHPELAFEKSRPLITRHKCWKDLDLRSPGDLEKRGWLLIYPLQ